MQQTFHNIPVKQTELLISFVISTDIGRQKFYSPYILYRKWLKLKSDQEYFHWQLASVYLSLASDQMKWHIALLFDSVVQGVIDIPLAPVPLGIIQLCLMNVMGYLWRLGNESPDKNQYVEQEVNQPVRFLVLFKVEHEAQVS